MQGTQTMACSRQALKCRHDGHVADVRLKGTSFSEGLLLLSPVMHWGVLINTNGWYGCEELKSACSTRVRNATNFATCLKSSALTLRVHSHSTNLTPFLIAFKDLLEQADSDRSQKVDLGRCRSQRPIRSPGLEAKDLRRPQIGVLTLIYLW